MQNPIPIEDFFRKPDRVQLRLSPGGRYLGWLEPAEVDGKRRLNVFVVELPEASVDGGELELGTGVVEQGDPCPDRGEDRGLLPSPRSEAENRQSFQRIGKPRTWYRSSRREQQRPFPQQRPCPRN